MSALLCSKSLRTLPWGEFLSRGLGFEQSLYLRIFESFLSVVDGDACCYELYRLFLAASSPLLFFLIP